MTDMINTSSPEADLWHVEVPSGQVLVVTLEQLDEAFNQGQVNEHTRVWQEGMACAVPLHELLGLDSEEEAPAPPPRVAAIPPAPVLRASPAPSMYPQARASVPPRSVAAAPAAASAWPPVVTRHAAPASGPSSSPARWQTSAVPSVIPTAFDVSDDFVPFAKPKRRGAVAFALVAMLAVAGGAAAFVNGNGATASAAAVAPPPPVAEPPRSHAYDPGNEPIHLRDVEPLVITKPDAPPVAASPKASTAAEAEAVRQAALKTANSKAPKAHAARTSTRSAQRNGKASGTSFKGTKSGNKYDPLNGGL